MYEEDYIMNQIIEYQKYENKNMNKNKKETIKQKDNKNNLEEKRKMKIIIKK